jgi:nuclear pore complex protein Nup155
MDFLQYYIGPDGRGTVDDISVKLREGCPSYYNESDYRFFQAVECLERAVVTMDSEEKERLAKEALDLLVKVPETADLLTVCKRFEDLRSVFICEGFSQNCTVVILCF